MKNHLPQRPPTHPPTQPLTHLSIGTFLPAKMFTNSYQHLQREPRRPTRTKNARPCSDTRLIGDTHPPCAPDDLASDFVPSTNPPTILCHTNQLSVLFHPPQSHLPPFHNTHLAFHSFADHPYLNSLATRRPSFCSAPLFLYTAQDPTDNQALVHSSPACASTTLGAV